MRVYETRATCLDWGSRNAALFKTWSFPATQWRYCWLREVYKSIKTFHFSLSTGDGDDGDGICSKCTYRNGISRKSSIASDIPMSKMLLSESRESAPKVCMSSNWRNREDLSWYFEMWRKLQRYDYHQRFRNKIWATRVLQIYVPLELHPCSRFREAQNHSSLLVIIPWKLELLHNLALWYLGLLGSLILDSLTSSGTSLWRLRNLSVAFCRLQSCKRSRLVTALWVHSIEPFDLYEILIDRFNGAD
jgi:hypothetical protein